jgi:hypothetical protein
MPEESRNLVTEVEFGPELAGQRVGWNAVTGYGRRPDEVLAVHIAAATIESDGASFEYEQRESESKQVKLFWSDAAKGFIATAGISVIIDKTRPPKEQERTPGPYWIFDDDLIRGSSEGRALRIAGDGGRVKTTDELDRKRTWIEGSDKIVSGIKENMHEADLDEYYPVVYYTANMLLAHERFRRGSSLGKVATETILLPDAGMHEITAQELRVADTIEMILSDEHREDKKMLRNLTIFGDVPAKDIPRAFEISRSKVANLEAYAIGAGKDLYAQTGIFLPIGFHGGRSWPYMDASLPPTDERSYGRELDSLSSGDPKPAQHELESELDELETRAKYAGQGVIALELLSRAEEAASE